MVIPSHNHANFAILQARIHEIWARFFSSSMKDDLRYTPSDCFETFPFPEGYAHNPILTAIGKQYYDFRANLLTRHNVGLTTLYNWFHDRDSACPEIPELRRLHAEMDRAALDAYGWTDIEPVCIFDSEFDDEDDEEESSRPGKKKYRYRWPDETRDEVLGRLLALNQERALAEGQIDSLDAPDLPTKKGARKAPTNKKKAAAASASLFD